MKHNCKLPRRISNLIVCSAALLGLAIPWPAQSSGEASVGARTFVDEFIELAEVHDVLATDDHVVGLVTVSIDYQGRHLDFDEAHVWHVSDEMVREMWAVPKNPYEVDEFFAA